MALFTCFPVKKTRRECAANGVYHAISVIKPEDHDHGCDCDSMIRKSSMADIRFCLRKFSWDEMQRLTANFSPSRVIGYGGFSTVYLANFPDSTIAAIKVYRSSSERLHRIYKQELEILQKLKHENIVKLLGFCDDREEGVLVFDYVPSGTLQEKLHEVKGSVLSWKSRMAIAFQLAQAIQYLHEKCPLQIVHGDIKASNVLLDEQLNCKLCDFGSAKMGFSSAVMSPSSRSVNRMMLGSPGYTDPHYLRTGLASKKNDVYSFGVILLEIITGIEAISARDGEMLTAKAGPFLRDSGKVAEMMDPRLGPAGGGGGFVMEEAMAMASLSARCLSDTPSLRPSMSDVLEIMKSSVGSIPFINSTDKMGALGVCSVSCI